MVAHSLGNIQLLYCVQRVFGTEILSRIKSLVSIAAPWAGSPQVSHVLLRMHGACTAHARRMHGAGTAGDVLWG